ncbi:MAG: type IV-A pilus assembly ATPase PilB, partial [Stagnimonas sp.]|nr:type IV-A pilus assembly ATPase PilB [Stagnimonas sp.]
MSAVNPNAPNVAQPYLGGLARRLLNDKVISEETARDLQQKAVKSSRSFVEVLVESKQVTAVQVADIASAEFGSPLIDISAIDLDMQAAKDVGEKLLRKHRALPLFKRGKKMFVAVSDPMNIQALDEFKFATGFTTEAILVEDDKLGRLIETAAAA